MTECSAGHMITGVALFTRKRHVALESETAHSTAFYNMMVLKKVLVVGSLCRLLACTMCCFVVTLVGVGF